MQKMKLDDIKIKDTYAMTNPKEHKMRECRDYWDKYRCQDRYIVVNNSNILIDGYIQYLILKENGGGGKVIVEKINLKIIKLLHISMVSIQEKKH